jgi:pimeloyl-ACP methyl ester carboxylesterase
MSSTPISPTSPLSPFPSIQTWHWRGFPITYQTEGDRGPAVVLVHGFGASLHHWRKNLPVLASSCRVYALDLIGFGGAAKPVPFEQVEYTFETWGAQIADFCREVVGGPAFLVANSVGCIAIMQAAVDHPEITPAVALLNCSLRLLHDRRRLSQPWYRRMGAPLLQKILKQQWVGNSFFRQIAQPKTVRKILLKAYARKEAVTDELVELLLTPARDEGAAAVFLAFTGYSQGPLPEDLLEILPCPALVIWGKEDPWEPIALGQEFTKFPQVKQFLPVEGVGHCPQDEAPEQVNPILLDWIRLHIGEV